MVVGEGTTGGHTPTLHFAVLGPVRAWHGDRPLPSGSPQQRALLAALLLRGGRTATAQELVDALWGDEPPQQALAALRTYASRLRKAFAPRTGVLVTEMGGYALRLGPFDELDVDTVGKLSAAAEKSTATGELMRAHELYGKALELWDGEALGGVPGPEAELQHARLAEQRLVLQELRLDVGLQAGLHAESVSELTALTTQHPLRERLRELLMLALYRSGRQAEALAVYADARKLLIDELGVEPRAELSDLQQRILNADASLSQGGQQSAAQAAIVRPAQLPATVPDFTGRAAFVAELGAQLAAAGGRVMAVSAVAGIGGVGKTTLAVQVAHAAREHFPDGQLYVDLYGAGSAPADPGAVLAAFLRALGTPDASIPEGIDERAALYRSLLDGRRVLTLLDNARDAAQVRHLLPGTPGCATLITSRVRMVDLAGAHLVDLDVMSPEEALTLFTRIVGPERVNAERDAAMDVVAACGFLPLAIRIAASRLAARRTWTVTVLARKLSDERGRLDELQAGDQAVKATFELGYGQLEREQARAFRLLGLADGPDISLPAAAALLDRSPATTEFLLESLVDTSLLESAAPGRYRFHDLVRLFARSCAERDEQPPPEREAARSRLLDFYLATAARVYEMQRPGDRLTAHLHATQYPALEFPTTASAVEWLFTEADCILACVRNSPLGPQFGKAADLLLVARDLSESGAFSLQFERAAKETLSTAQKAEDARTEGRAHIALAQADSHAGRFDSSENHGRHAFLLGVVADDPVSRCHAANERGIVALYQGQHEDAEAHLTRALEEFRADGNRPGEASVLGNLSHVNLMLGRTDNAVRLADQCMEILRSLGSDLRLANGQYALGRALAEDGQHESAISQFTLSLATFRSHRQRLWEGMTLFRMAATHVAMRDAAQAATLAEQALAQLRNVGGPWRRANVLVVLGRALADIGQAGRAQACWQEALRTYEEQGSAEAADVRNLLGSQTV
ncbi:AfsR/SARP family transcriptional regulator [Streptomyces litchfieldiae]|uniref:BTAD domain-containing putative transcriptional regulator n=1 Tax=Streptomyces litchfieldiae TaxID=3075543 RepID=A0ABU2MNH2_9ACTN|nr:BTAD domain-containing putative transcriptional regulator [Streptomyces sp. DSM 44938]MDT0343161.1 BTAD domain-containing putative transcriptional regulator [Streptomyces sp. DSM 44938]